MGCYGQARPVHNTPHPDLLKRYEWIDIEIVVDPGWRLNEHEPPTMDGSNDQPVLLNRELNCCCTDIAEIVSHSDCEGVIAVIVRVPIICVRNIDAEREIPIRFNRRNNVPVHHIIALAICNGVCTAI